MTNEELNELDTPRCSKCGVILLGELKVCTNWIGNKHQDRPNNESVQYGGLLRDILKKWGCCDAIH